MKEKRYQECNALEKIWRRRHYLKIPFKWIHWRLFTRNSDLNGKTVWRLFIGVAQMDMRWYYTDKEVRAELGKYRKKRKKEK